MPPKQNRSLRTEGVFIDELRKRLKHRRDTVIGVIGARGSGKSIIAASIMAVLDPTYLANIEARTSIGDPEKTVNTLTDPNLAPGTAIMFDEAGVGFSSDDYWKTTSRMLRDIFQVMRLQKAYLFVCLLSLPDAQSSLRRQFDFIIEVQASNRGNTRARLTCARPNRKSTKVFFPRPWFRVQTPGDRVTFLNGLWYPNIPMRRRFGWLQVRVLRKKYRDIIDKLGNTGKRGIMKNSRDGISAEKDATLIPYVEQIKADPVRFSIGTRIALTKVQAIFGLSEPKARRVKILLDSHSLSTPNTYNNKGSLPLIKKAMV